MITNSLEKVSIDETTGEVVLDSAEETISEAEATEDSTKKDTVIIQDENNENLIEVEEEENEEEEGLTEDPNSPEEVQIGEETEEESSEDNFKEVITSMKEKFFPDATDEETDKIETFEDMQSLMADQFKKELGSYKDSYRKDMVNKLIKDGLINQSQLKEEHFNISSKEDLTDNIDLQTKILTKLYKKKGIDDKTISKVLNNLVDLEEEAYDAYDEFKVILDQENEDRAKKSIQEEEDQKNQYSKFNDNLKSEISSLSSLIPDKTLSDTEQQELLVNINPTLEKIGKNPAKYYAMLSYLDRFGMLDGNFENILKKGESIGTKKLTSILNDKRMANGAATRKRKPESNSDYNLSNSDIPSIYSKKK